MTLHRVAAALALALTIGLSRPAATQEPYGIGLEGFAYPYPVQMLALPSTGERLRSAYMDVKPTANANARTVVLLTAETFHQAIGKASSSRSMAPALAWWSPIRSASGVDRRPV